DGILFRFPEAPEGPEGPSEGPEEELPVDIVSSLSSDDIRKRLLDHLADSALFGAVFRQNAYRALLLPGSGRGRRTPFWLQRLRAKDLLAVARGFPDFPIILETFRDCLEDEMDLPNLEGVIDAVQRGEIKIVHVESRFPSPVAQGLNFQFESFYLYEWDTPKAERSMQALQLDRAALAKLFQDPSFAGTLRPEAMDDVVSEVSRLAPGYRARTAVDLAQLLADLGDLTREEIANRTDGNWEEWLSELETDGRVSRLAIETPSGSEERWVAACDVDRLRRALEPGSPGADVRSLLLDFAARNGPFTTRDLEDRYGLQADVVAPGLDSLVEDGGLVRGFFTENASEIEWADTQTISLVQRRTLGILRSEISPVSRLRYAAEVARLQGVARDEQSARPDAADVLLRLRGVAASPSDWASVILPARIPDAGVAIEERFASGDFIWVVEPSKDESPVVKIVPRATGNVFFSGAFLELLERGPEDLQGLAGRLWDFMTSEGVATSADIRSAMTGTSLLDLRSAVRDLVLRGLLTGNSWSALLAIIREPATGSQRQTSGTRSGVKENRRRAARSIREVSLAMPPETAWSITSRHAVTGPAATPEERARQQADALLARYGVVSREALELDGSGWEWRPIAAQLNIDELGGRARRGYFVQGLPGLQYAAPQIVESLRERPDAKLLALLNARDPANVLGRSVADEVPERAAPLLRFNRIASTSYVLSGAEPVLLVEDGGARLTVTEEPDLAAEVRRAIESFVLREWSKPGRNRRIEVELWNGEAVLKSPGVELLEEIGFRREYRGMVYDALQARARPVRDR
ncbi:MAG: hypothetical protein IIB28_01740, partial [Chloroflexi bacterium]|nr:hypothetical protein [Chloroflexota bacterium]